MPPLAFRSTAAPTNAVGSPVILPSGTTTAVPADLQTFLAQMAAARKRDQVIYGRYTAPQLWHRQNVNLLAQQQILVPKNLTLEKPHERLMVMFRFRLTITTDDYATTLPEIPQNILKSIRMWGSAGAFGAQTMWQISGATLFALPHVMGGSPQASYVTVKEVGGDQMRMAVPGLPFLPAIPTSQGQLDIILMFQLPTSPYMGQGTDAKRQISRYMLSPQDWGNTIQVEINTGDASSFGTPGIATVDMTAYGSNTGLPEVSFFQNFALLGPDRAYTRRNGLVLRVERPINTLTAATNQTRMNILDQKITTGLMVKSGTSITSASGITSFATLSDEQLDETRVVHGTTPVRYNQSNETYRAYYGDMFDTPAPVQGYLPISFMEAQNVMNSYRADALEGGANFEIDTDVDVPNSANIQSVVQEEIIQPNNGGPFGPVVTL